MIPEISCDALYQRLLAGEPLALIEALGADYFDDVHLPGALNMQPDRVRELAPALLPDRSLLIVVYCSRTCDASAQTAQRLAAMGYIDVVVFLGGKEEWVEAGLPVERLDS